MEAITCPQIPHCGQTDHQQKAIQYRSRSPPGWRLILAMIEPLALECGEDTVRVIVWQYVTDW